MYHQGCDPNAQDYKTITVARLIELLQAMPPDWEVWANDVRNLNLGDGKVWQGYIDIADELFYPNTWIDDKAAA